VSDELRFEVDVTEADRKALQRHTAAAVQTRPGGLSRWIDWRITVVVVLLAVVLAVIESGVNWSSPEAQQSFEWLASVVLLVGFAVLFGFRLRLRRPGVQLGHHVFVVGAEGLRHIGGGGEALVSWGRVRDVTRDEAHVFVIVEGPESFVLPTRSLAPPAAQQLYQVLSGHLVSAMRAELAGRQRGAGGAS
jgi:hypothetical protein